ncbi:permease prefix domain 1-containing protein [Brevibacillus centrosporus]|uniref:permease prefix domain 1-containing protein n=1 Tax=Brevibacillus centrosporus TaxID=54910 RepID=UPI003986D4DB
MDKIQQHVDRLFRTYKGSKQAQELKQEILSNLQARVADMTMSGVSREAAISSAIANIPSIAHLLDEKPRVFLYRFWVEWVQRVLLFTLIAWIVTMPFRFVGNGTGSNTLLMFIALGIGIVYGGLLLLKRYDRKTGGMNVQAALRLRKIGWLLWVLLMGVSLFYTTALHFGSNLWFSRPIHISGPYQFANVAIDYLKPFVTLLIPLALHMVPKLLMKYEVGEADGCTE